MPKVLFAASEANPLAKVGGLGDVAGALPKALKKLGVDVRLVIPRYRSIETPAKLPGSEVPVYYVESKKHFDRDQIYGYEDDPDRFAFFSKGILELAKKEGFEPDIIHINDYHTSLLPVLLKTEYARDPFFAASRTVLTIHNLANQGNYDIHLLQEVGLGVDATPALGLDTRDGEINLLLQGIEAADFITTVSPTYAKEILTAQYGEGLEKVLAEKSNRLVGVLNGIDAEVYNPATDPYIKSNFSLRSLEKREANKKKLVSDLKINRPDWPIIGMVSRIVSQKGFDLFIEAADELRMLRANFVILGVGDPLLEGELKKISQASVNIQLLLEFNEARSRQIYAGSDLFLIPSRFEPCGLTQMIAMRYGSIPIVRKTGGLADTVEDEKTGIVFEGYSSTELVHTIERAMEAYQDPRQARFLQENGMIRDFSWDKSAKEYAKLYEEVRRLSKVLP